MAVCSIDEADDRKVDSIRLQSAFKSGLEKLIASEEEVTHYDTIVGDGDCGVGLKRGAEGILKLLGDGQVTDDPVAVLTKIAGVVETTMDGTSGALYAIFLNSLTANVRKLDSSSQTQLTAKMWGQALGNSLEALGKYTPAQPGDRTLMDSLVPFVDTLKETGNTRKAAEVAKTGADSTKGMKATLGRSVYVGGEGYIEVPDPGAYGLSQFLTGLAEAL